MRRLALPLVLLAALVATYAATTASGSATLYVSPSGSDASSCTQAAPCATLGKAWNVASGGDVVEVAPGSYGGVNLTGTKTPPVVFHASGATLRSVVLTRVNGLEIDDATISVGFDDTAAGTNRTGGSSNVTMLRDHIAGEMYLNSVSNFTISGGELGPFATCPTSAQGCSEAQIFAPTNFVLDHEYVHDAHRSTTAQHIECMQIAGGNGVSITSDTWKGCDIFDLSPTEYAGSGAPTNYVIENNAFYAPTDAAVATNDATYSVDFNNNASAFSNVLIDYNSFGGPLLLNYTSASKPAYSNVVLRGNAGALSFGTSSCQPSSKVTLDHDVWSSVNGFSSLCGGSSDKLAAPGFISDQNLDLAPGAAAIDAGATMFPTLDIHGTPRPQGAVADAGSDEVGVVVVPPPEDTVPTIVLKPLTITFTFNVTGGHTTTTCALDGGVAKACVSPVSYTVSGGPVANAVHTLVITTTNSKGSATMSQKVQVYKQVTS